MKKINLITYSALSAFTLNYSAVHAATVVWDGGGTDNLWSNAQNWVGDALPGVADKVEIGGSSVVDFDVIFSSTVPNGQVAIDLKDSARLNLSSGALTLTNGNFNTSPINFSANSVLNISGGTHQLLARTGSGESGTIRVTGDEANITFQQGSYNGMFDFVLDDTGVSMIHINSWYALGGASLNVDGSAFSGVGSFTLFDIAANGGINSTFDMGKVTITGFDSGTNWELQQYDDAGRSIVKLNVTAVPEPSAAALLGLGSLSLILRRSRSYPQVR